MAAIHELLKQVPDPALRTRLEQEFAHMSHNKKFGLVFEDHIPECTPLYGVAVKRGSTVARKSGRINNVFSVLKISEGNALCRHMATGATETIAVDELVSVAQFGEPIFPTLQPVDSVENAPDSELWHTLIEADNYHALQLLEYLYPKKVDCIYIDPPYNTGARDWKYNNDYVDSADGWRHSKWLSMMQKRLRIARHILAEDGVLITTIDDNEYAHLWMLLNEIFPDYQHNCITIQHNPGGTQGKKFSVTNEYAIFSYSTRSVIFRKNHQGGDTYNLRRWGSTSGRYEGATCFYPVILDENLNVIGFGDLLDESSHPSAQVEPQPDGTVWVWPLDKHNIEKKWRYGRDTVESVRDRLFTQRRGDHIEIILRRESEPPKTVWTDSLFNAEAFGTDLIKLIVDGGFSYPKSLYAVREALIFSVGGKKDALIVDFFAGSGTTLHAVNLLNAEDGGHRRCILVTNNEVSDADAKELKRNGFKPGDSQWEAKGICCSVTWPRTAYSILGKKGDGTPLSGEYFTNFSVEKESNRSFYHVGFWTNPHALSLQTKKQIVAMIGGQTSALQKKISKLSDDVPKSVKACISESILPQSYVKADTRFIVSEKHTASILFDPEEVTDWLSALEEHDDITDFYIVAPDAATFNTIKARVIDLLGPVRRTEPYKRPMSEGFPANVEYFRLGFLDKNAVSLGRQFKEILPLLWLKSGAKGKRPEVSEEELDMLILPHNKFAVLLDETKYATFMDQLAATEGIDTVYFVTNSEEAFRDMSAGIKASTTYQLYRDYVDNFVIGSRRNAR